MKMERDSESDLGFVWHPTDDRLPRASSVASCLRTVFRISRELHRRSVDDPQWFWNAVLADLGIEFSKPYDKVIDTSPGLPWTRWCVGGEMNIVHNCLDKWIGTSERTLAGIPMDDRRGHERCSDLRRAVATGESRGRRAEPARIFEAGRHRHLHADDAGDCHRVLRDRQDRRHRPAVVFRIWRRSHRHPSSGLGSKGTDYCGRHSASGPHDAR